jgi:hypothetical protein
MWCVGNWNILHVGHDTNSYNVASFHNNMKIILYSLRERFIEHKMD